MSLKILVTGATGFIGRPLIKTLLASGFDALAMVRDEGAVFLADDLSFRIDDLTSEQWSKRNLSGVDVVIHLAARAHIMNDAAPNPFDEYRKINTDGTLKLARHAAEQGVSRFIFMSSIKVNGQTTPVGQPFTPLDSCDPVDPYAISKLEAEQKLLSLAQETGMEVVVIRSPLVYGPGVKANFAALIRWVHKGWPFPLGAVKNRRSLVALENLLSFIILCINHPKAANEVFLIADGEDLSTAELAMKISNAFNKELRLFKVPISVLKFGARCFGKFDRYERLTESLQVDNSKAQILLGWVPVITMDEQIQKTVAAYLNEEIV